MTEGTYAGVRFSPATQEALAALQRRHGVPAPTPREKFHVTLVYSRLPVEWEPADRLDEAAVPIGWEVWDQGDGNRALVLLLASEWLTARHVEARLRGATWDHEDYRPHVTLSYDAGDFDTTGLPIPDLDLEIVSEYAEPLKLDWNSDE